MQSNNESAHLYCCISVCRNYKDPTAKVDLYPLPKDEYERGLWCKVLNIPSSVAESPLSRVCGLHFRYKYFLNQGNEPATSQQQLPLTIIINNQNGPRILSGVSANNLMQSTIVQNPVVLPQTAVAGSSGSAQNFFQAFVIAPPSQTTVSTNNSDVKKEVKPTNLLVKGELFLDCQEENLSAAQLSANDTDWNAFTKEVENVTISNTSQESNKTVTVINSDQLSSAGLPKPLNLPTGMPLTLTSNALGQHFLKFPQPQNTPPPNSSYTLKIPDVKEGGLFSQKMAQATSSSGTQYIKLVPSRNQTPQIAGAPQILQFRTPNSNAGSFQILNKTSGTMPQLIRIGNQTLQLVTANVGQQKSVTVSEPGKVSTSSGVSNNQFASGSSSLLQGEKSANLNDSDLSPLPSFLQPNVPNATAFPVKLQKAEEISKISPLSEVILPLLPKDKGGDTESILSDSAQLTEPSSTTNSLGNEEEEEIVVDVDLSNVPATVYEEQSSPETTTSESVNVLNIPVQLNNNDSSEVVAIGNFSKSNSISILKKFIESRTLKETMPSYERPSPTTVNPPLGSGSFLPVIVDVMSAKEGGQAIYTKSEDSNKPEEDEVEIIEEPNKNLNQTNKSSNQTLNIIQNVKVSNNNSPSVLQSFPKIMHTHSIFSLQKSIPVVPSGHEIKPDTRNLFSLKTHFTKNRSLYVDGLKARLRAEDYIVNSVWWLNQNKHLPQIPPCHLCGCKDFRIERNEKFYDKYCWTCQNFNCRTQEPIKRPKFFERFNFYTLEDLLLLTYHWACQSDIDEILEDVSLDVEKIWNYYKALQDLCLSVVASKGKLGCCPKARIETSVVKLGNFFILGALERFNRNTRLQVISVNEAFETAKHLDILESWVTPDSILISESKIPNQYLPLVHKVNSDPSFTDLKSNGYHIMNVSRYLVRNMISIFGKAKVHFLDQDVIQGFLNELQWRDRFGKFLDQAFWSILKDIGSCNDGTSFAVKIQKGSSLESEPSHLSDNLLKRWGRPKQIAMKENDDIKFVEVLPQTLVIDRGQEEKVPEKTYEKFSYSQVSTASKMTKISRVMRDTGLLNILFQDLPEIPGGETIVTPRHLLGIKIILNDSPEALDRYKAESISLGLRLSAEGFINSPVRWLVKKGFIRSKAPCYVCHNASFLRDNPKYDDGCSWLCQWPSCKFENIFKRPHFYARFPMLPMAHMNAMVYHWTVHSEISRITSDAPMEISKLQHVWRSFQVLCSTSLRRKKVRLGGEGEMVEVAIVQFGKLYILGAMERKTKYTLLRTFFVDLTGQIPVFLKVLAQWILPFSYVIVNATKYFQLPPEYNIMFADTSITDPTDPGFHVLNITSYLLQHVSTMFGCLKAEDVRAEVLQIYLDELMWRERYGMMPNTAFYNILGDIFDLETRDKPEENLNNRLSNLQKENVCMYDKLAVQPEENGPPQEQESKTLEIDLSLEAKIDPASLPKCRVVLKRLSKEVLKYYDCLHYLDPTYSPLDSDYHPCSTLRYYNEMKNDPTTKVFYQFCKTKVSRRNHRTYGKWSNIIQESPPESPPTESCPSNHSTTKSVSGIKRRQFASDEEESDVDGDLLDNTSLQSNDSNDSRLQSNDSRLSVSSNNSVCVISESTYPSMIEKTNPDIVVKVEQMEPEEAETQISTQKGVKQRTASHKTVTSKTVPQRTLTQRTAKSRSARSVTRSVIPKTEIKAETSKMETVTKENVEDELICVECGKSITIDHFMKQFLCMDCKRSVYTTSCCNSFMEHRGYLLFGKRMPRRNQVDKEQYGLHKVVTLQDSYSCSCGYQSNIGNKLATHMVQCGKSTCFYHADIS